MQYFNSVALKAIMVRQLTFLYLIHIIILIVFTYGQGSVKFVLIY